MKCLSLCHETGREKKVLCVSQSDGMKVIGLGWKKQLLRSKIVALRLSIEFNHSAVRGMSEFLYSRSHENKESSIYNVRSGE